MWTRDAIVRLPPDEYRAISALIDEAGARSARAQGLPAPITSTVRPSAPPKKTGTRRQQSDDEHPRSPTPPPHPPARATGPAARGSASVPRVLRRHAPARRPVRPRRHPQGWAQKALRRQAERRDGGDGTLLRPRLLRARIVAEGRLGLAAVRRVPSARGPAPRAAGVRQAVAQARGVHGQAPQPPGLRQAEQQLRRLRRVLVRGGAEFRRRTGQERG